MRLICLLIVTVALAAPAQSRVQGMLGYPERKAHVPTEQEKTQARLRAEKQRQAALKDAGNYRVVAGKLYNTALAANWEWVPGENHHGKFEQMTPDGPMFEIEKRMSRSYGPGIADGSVWWEFDRRIIVKNYPHAAVVAGASLMMVRALPVSTSKQHPGVAIYDCGTPPQPKPLTNTVAVTNTLAAPVEK